MMDHRTKKQIAADVLDLEIYNLCRELERFVMEHNAKGIAGMATSIDAMRYHVRLYMHPEDREKTSLSFRGETA